MNPEEMFRKLATQDHIRKIMNNESNEEEIIVLSKMDLIKACMVGVETCLNLMVYKEIVTEGEVFGMGEAVKNALNDMFEE